MNSLERVKAAIHFNSPDKVPIMNFGSVSNVFPLPSLIPKDWKPGHAQDEIGLFPYGEGLFEWDVPD